MFHPTYPKGSGPRLCAAALLALAPIAVVACGGKVADEGAPTRAVENAPQNTPAPSDGCTLACERMFVTCTRGASELDRCVTSCRTEHDGIAAAIYAGCIAQLGCEEIERGLSMGYGPLGECAARAHRRR